jgi:hypothetical protein
MKVYRYKNANEDNQTVSIEFEYKEPIIFSLEKPEDKDYELFEDQNYLDNFVAEKYAINQSEGQLYKHLISAKITNMVTNGIITSEQSQVYSETSKDVRLYLSEGYWHSAYYAHVVQVPTPEIESIHFEVLEYIKNYVNTKYPPNFFIE